MTDMWPIWVVAGLAFLALEVHQQAFFAVFLSAASFAAAIADAAGVVLWIQGLVFVLVAFLGIALVRRPIAAHYARTHNPLAVPGVFGGFVGQSALALDEIGDALHPGHASLGGDTYLAVVEAAGPVAAQTRLVVTATRGTTLIVMPESPAQSASVTPATA